jgi:hypothetical protein
MGPIACIELWQDAFHVGFYRALRDVQLGGNHLVGFPCRDAAKHFGFALAQLIVRNVLCDF